MKILLALYDPAFQTADGNYWTWYHPQLAREQLVETYYEGLAADIPQHPNELEATTLWGGIYDLSKDWRCYYRFLNGGRDPQGRPGRYVVVCGFVKSSETELVDPTEFYWGDITMNLASVALQQCPVPATVLEIHTPQPHRAQRPDSEHLFENTGQSLIGACKATSPRCSALGTIQYTKSVRIRLRTTGSQPLQIDVSGNSNSQFAVDYRRQQQESDVIRQDRLRLLKLTQPTKRFVRLLLFFVLAFTLFVVIFMIWQSIHV
ncbi:hypothetical protein [Anatilimnocola floriformis]|uniref:hypothetical protein n=1 Tax=Anatilimnocola floriformis TaxID=2948575 RepID=UPI0020C1F2AB|nr:hypothetical protein [Anatilimnocola floriformis]